MIIERLFRVNHQNLLAFKTETLSKGDAQRKSICDGRVFIDRPAGTNASLKIFC